MAPKGAAEMLLFKAAAGGNRPEQDEGLVSIVGLLPALFHRMVGGWRGFLEVRHSAEFGINLAHVVDPVCSERKSVRSKRSKHHGLGGSFHFLLSFKQYFRGKAS